MTEITQVMNPITPNEITKGWATKLPTIPRKMKNAIHATGMYRFDLESFI
jgi:hypothetical protein